jgi:hypothetical protein
MMRNILRSVIVFMVLSLTACGSLAVQGDVISAAEVTKQAADSSTTELQVSDTLGAGIDTAEATKSPTVAPTSVPTNAPALTDPAAQGAGVPVVDWSGYVIGLPAGAQFNDYFLPAGGNATQYGIDSALAASSGERELADEIEALRDSGKTVHIWGDMTCNVPDVGGCQIVVWKIETDDGTVYEITPMPATP